MDPNREEELLLHVAAGLDPLTAIIAASDDPKPPKLRRSGWFVAVSLVAVVLWLLTLLT